MFSSKPSLHRMDENKLKKSVIGKEGGSGAQGGLVSSVAVEFGLMVCWV